MSEVMKANGEFNRWKRLGELDLTRDGAGFAVPKIRHLKDELEVRLAGEGVGEGV
jgi:hypothetical protein